ncbi:hypothetical protein [Streptomyces sp. NPDC051636]|uniref:hypothetical protein n=1 Tax=Streptomyces sp. NPDC051636 TaxID=3365663 RepID=UPI00378DB7EC
MTNRYGHGRLGRAVRSPDSVDAYKSSGESVSTVGSDVVGGEARGTFGERMAEARRRRPGAYAHLFDGRPKVVIRTTQLLPDQAIQLATAYGYRHLETRGSKSVRRRVFVPDPDPAARWEALPPGTSFEVAAQHPAFHGASARAARNHAELIKNEQNLLKLLPAAVFIFLGMIGVAAQLISTGKGVLLAPLCFGVLLDVAVVWLMWSRKRKRRELLAQAGQLMLTYPPHGFRAWMPDPHASAHAVPQPPEASHGIGSVE